MAQELSMSRLCEICNYPSVERTDKGRKNQYRKHCGSCRSILRRYKPNTQSLIEMIKYKAELNPCMECGFIPKNKCQLDIDHIDGYNGNNEAKNLQILCANCHRLKTLHNNDYK